MNNLLNILKNAKDNNKLVQAYLIGNVTYDTIKSELISTINNIFFDDKFESENNPDLYILKDSISKNDIKSLIKDISTTSQFNNKKVYIIDKCENLNDFSYNAILKTLEEPQEGVYAILLSSNIDSVKDTISSRCQKIFISSSIKDEIIEEEVYNFTKDFIYKIEEYGIRTIGLFNEIYDEIEDKDKLLKIFKYSLIIYNNELNNKVNDNISDNIIYSNNSIEELSKKMIIINSNIKNSMNNLNKNLTIDRFIIEMSR